MNETLYIARSKNLQILTYSIWKTLILLIFLLVKSVEMKMAVLWSFHILYTVTFVEPTVIPDHSFGKL